MSTISKDGRTPDRISQFTDGTQTTGTGPSIDVLNDGGADAYLHDDGPVEKGSGVGAQPAEPPFFGSVTRTSTTSTGTGIFSAVVATASPGASPTHRRNVLPWQAFPENAAARQRGVANTVQSAQAAVGSRLVAVHRAGSRSESRQTGVSQISAATSSVHSLASTRDSDDEERDGKVAQAQTQGASPPVSSDQPQQRLQLPVALIHHLGAAHGSSDTHATAIAHPGLASPTISTPLFVVPAGTGSAASRGIASVIVASQYSTITPVQEAAMKDTFGAMATRADIPSQSASPAPLFEGAVPVDGSSVVSTRSGRGLSNFYQVSGLPSASRGGSSVTSAPRPRTSPPSYLLRGAVKHEQISPPTGSGKPERAAREGRSNSYASALSVGSVSVVARAPSSNLPASALPLQSMQLPGVAKQLDSVVSTTPGATFDHFLPFTTRHAGSSSGGGSHRIAPPPPPPDSLPRFHAGGPAAAVSARPTAPHPRSPSQPPLGSDSALANGIAQLSRLLEAPMLRLDDYASSDEPARPAQPPVPLDDGSASGRRQPMRLDDEMPLLQLPSKGTMFPPATRSSLEELRPIIAENRVPVSVKEVDIDRDGTDGGGGDSVTSSYLRALRLSASASSVSTDASFGAAIETLAAAAARAGSAFGEGGDQVVTAPRSNPSGDKDVSARDTIAQRNEGESTSLSASLGLAQLAQIRAKLFAFSHRDTQAAQGRKDNDTSSQFGGYYVDGYRVPSVEQAALEPAIANSVSHVSTTMQPSLYSVADVIANARRSRPASASLNASQTSATTMPPSTAASVVGAVCMPIAPPRSASATILARMPHHSFEGQLKQHENEHAAKSRSRSVYRTPAAADSSSVAEDADGSWPHVLSQSDSFISSVRSNRPQAIINDGSVQQGLQNQVSVSGSLSWDTLAAHAARRGGAALSRARSGDRISASPESGLDGVPLILLAPEFILQPSPGKASALQYHDDPSRLAVTVEGAATHSLIITGKTEHSRTAEDEVRLARARIRRACCDATAGALDLGSEQNMGSGPTPAVSAAANPEIIVSPVSLESIQPHPAVSISSVHSASTAFLPPNATRSALADHAGTSSSSPQPSKAALAILQLSALRERLCAALGPAYNKPAVMSAWVDAAAQSTWAPLARPQAHVGGGEKRERADDDRSASTFRSGSAVSTAMLSPLSSLGPNREPIASATPAPPPHRPPPPAAATQYHYRLRLTDERLAALMLQVEELRRARERMLAAASASSGGS